MLGGELVPIAGGREKWWTPSYQTPKGKPYTVDEVAVAECPVSLLDRHPDLRAAVDLVSVDRVVKNGTGAVMYGPDSGQWPAVFYDLVAIFNNYVNLESAAEHRAILDER